MMKKHGRSFLLILLFGVLAWLLSDTARLRAAAGEALHLCTSAVIPALLPFLIVSDLLIRLGLGSLLAPHLAGLMALYHLPGCAGSALLLGLLGGYPIGARTAATLYQQGQLTRAEADRLLTFCNNANPVFFLSVLGSGVFHSVRIGLYLWLIHLLSALLTGLCFRGRTAGGKRSAFQPPIQAVSIVSALSQSLRQGGASMLSISVCVVFFYTLLTPLRALEGPLPTLLIGLTELFSLTPRLTAAPLDLVLAAGCSGWGGLSVLVQTAAVLEEAGLSPRPCFRGKLVQGLLSALLALLLLPWILG